MDEGGWKKVGACKMDMVLANACVELHKNGVVCREHIVSYLNDISCEEANMYYQVFVAMVVYSSHEFQEFCAQKQISLNWLPNIEDAFLNKFIDGFIVVGDIVDKLADCAQYEKHDRIVLWQEEQLKMKQMREQHLLDAKHQKAKSDFLLKSRHTNEIAFVRVHKTIKTPLKEWEVVIKTDSSELLSKSVMFWRHLQVEKLSVLQKRAMIHKLETIKTESYLEGNVNRTLKELQDDVFCTEMQLEPGKCSVSCFPCSNVWTFLNGLGKIHR